jgi:hypothetical protein
MSMNFWVEKIYMVNHLKFTLIYLVIGTVSFNFNIHYLVSFESVEVVALSLCQRLGVDFLNGVCA